MNGCIFILISESISDIVEGEQRTACSPLSRQLTVNHFALSTLSISFPLRMSHSIDSVFNFTLDSTLFNLDFSLPLFSFNLRFRFHFIATSLCDFTTGGPFDFSCRFPSRFTSCSSPILSRFRSRFHFSVGLSLRFPHSISTVSFTGASTFGFTFFFRFSFHLRFRSRFHI